MVFNVINNSDSLQNLYSNYLPLKIQKIKNRFYMIHKGEYFTYFMELLHIELKHCLVY